MFSAPFCSTNSPDFRPPLSVTLCRTRPIAQGVNDLVSAFCGGVLVSAFCKAANKSLFAGVVVGVEDASKGIAEASVVFVVGVERVVVGAPTVARLSSAAN